MREELDTNEKADEQLDTDTEESSTEEEAEADEEAYTEEVDKVTPTRRGLCVKAEKVGNTEKSILSRQESLKDIIPRRLH